MSDYDARAEADYWRAVDRDNYERWAREDAYGPSFKNPAAVTRWEEGPDE